MTALAAGESRANQIARTAVPLACLSSLTLALNLAWNAALARRFGASGELDAFWVGLALPKAVADSLHLGLLVLLFVVVFSISEAAGGAEREWRLASSVFNVVLLASLSAIPLLQVFAPALVGYMGPGLDADQLGIAESTLRRVSWMLAITFVTGAAAAMLYVRKRFLPFATARVAGLTFQVCFLLLAAEAWGVDAAVWAVLGASLVTLGVCLPYARRLVFRYRAEIDLGGSEGRAVGTLFAALVAFAVFAFLNQASDRFFASLMEPGSISALEFAWRFEIPVSQLLSFSVAIPTFALFAVQAASGRLVDFRETLTISVRMIALSVVPVVGFMTVLRAPLVSFWLGRGAFSPEAAALVASLLPLLAVVFICRGFSVVMVFGLLTLQRSRALLAILSAEVLANTVLNLVLGRLLGVMGVTLATAISIAAASLCYWGLLLRRVGGFSLRGFWQRGWKAIAVNAAAIGTLWIVYGSSWPGGLGDDALVQLPLLGASFAGFVTVYVILCLLFGLVEVRHDGRLPRLRLTASEWGGDGRGWTAATPGG